MKVVGFAPDLMDQSRIRAAAEGHELVFARDREDLVEAAAGAPLVLVDLSRPGVLGVLSRLDTRVIAFGSHVDRELLAAATDAGCEVLARSQFFRQLPDLLA